jgi:hypothetical protein
VNAGMNCGALCTGTPVCMVHPKMKVYEDRRLEVHPSAPADRSPLVVHGSEKAYNYMNINSGSLVAIIAVTQTVWQKAGITRMPYSIPRLH